MPEEAKINIVKLVLVGIRKASLVEDKKTKKSLVSAWLPVPDNKKSWTKLLADFQNGDESEICLYGVKKMPKARPGTIYEFESPKPGSIYPSSARWVGHIEEKDVVVQWQAQFDAFRSAQEADKLALKDEFKEALEPIRQAYYRLSSFQRAALLVKVLHYIQR